MKNLRSLLAIIDKELDGLSFDSNDRNDLSAALFDVAIEHSKAIVVLFENSLNASSYALVRPLFESFIRAAWIQHCACDEQIATLIKKDQFPLHLGEMLESVEKERNWVGTLSNIKKMALKNMHSYTHGGIQIVARRLKDGSLFHSIDREEINEVIKFIALLAFLSFNEIALIAKTSDKDNVIKKMYEDMCRCYFPKNEKGIL
ncbi:MAG: hypothetical protein KJ550_10810 [Proteobacteria bacterium]|nr:hypothetical protein [Pseudomonadota bacterium]MBU4015132.1 hypothetical protein [Patescibacteria group bacterium]MBU4067024.1 hypothetical protein [Pseudomonadota bacterium]MBU4319394.1 hypothetical protein [Pseudomonadota bacterium]